jgi:hypothetical protein
VKNCQRFRFDPEREKHQAPNIKHQRNIKNQAPMNYATPLPSRPDDFPAWLVEAIYKHPHAQQLLQKCLHSPSPISTGEFLELLAAETFTRLESAQHVAEQIAAGLKVCSVEHTDYLGALLRQRRRNSDTRLDVLFPEHPQEPSPK